MLKHGPLYLIHTTHLYSSGSDSFTHRTASWSPHLITTISLGQTHLMDTKIHHLEELHCCGFLSHSDLPSKVIVTLMWVNNPTPGGLPTQNSGIHWINRLNSKPIRFYTATTTLHTSFIPSGGMHQLSLTRKDRYPSLPTWIKQTIHTYLPQQFYLFHFPSCFWAIH